MATESKGQRAAAKSDKGFMRRLNRILERQFTEPEEDFVQWLAGHPEMGGSLEENVTAVQQLAPRALQGIAKSQAKGAVKAATGGKKGFFGHKPVGLVDDVKKAYNIIRTISIKQAGGPGNNLYVSKNKLTGDGGKKYRSVFLDGNPRGKPLCHLYFFDGPLQIKLVNFRKYRTNVIKSWKSHDIESVNDIKQHAKQLVKIIKRHAGAGDAEA